MAEEGILVLNAGSSSVKFTVFALAGRSLAPKLHGQVEGIGTGITPRLIARNRSGEPVADEAWPSGTHQDILQRLINWIHATEGNQLHLRAAGHRVVHGGMLHDAPVRVTPAILGQLRAFVPLAPLHQPHNLAPIETLAKLYPELPQIACFDTAFHRHKRPEASLVGLPRRYLDAGIKRYGFHGLSYEYIAGRLAELEPTRAKGRVIAAHLGSGASMCAMKDGVAIDSSMGFTAVDGLMMGTRPGSLDPGIILHLLQQEKLDVPSLEKLLYRESGLLGVSGGLSNDMRILLDSDSPAAQEAIDLFVYKAAKEIGALAVTIGGLDVLVFTAGIGERSAEIRKRICALVSWMGIKLDPAANTTHALRISTDDSPIAVWAIPTDEELMIARHTARLIEHAP
ncbi:acetate/propionate family kinase [Haematospirillum sp. 15-248]|uniref:acetate/propionate family kinase n=1 Tax=Haematospirillum sp. 15-248 TaxID=2723107 RepID=UPI00143C5EF5|nr:acetate/propionate family kinase [Haematospirillum sp. 15-248]NKD87233.1 acetate/propionate family kinase [Haematospirillum sp. 15-248]